MIDASAGESGSLRCLVTGATGYVGGRLVPELLAAGYRVRVMVRDPSRVGDHPWGYDVEVATADATSAEQVRAALDEVDVAYYLLHSIGSGSDFGSTERQMAETFAAEAAEAGVGRIVYLGGLTPADTELSEHLSSRHAVGQLFVDADVPTTYLRAAVILGSGSASFEMLRYVTERLPAMVTPRWVRNEVQPIAVSDVLRYLVGSASMPSEVNRSFDIGGPDVLTYREMMQRFAKVAGLQRRPIVSLPVLTPKLSSLWVGLVTPVPGSIARPLVESLRNPVVCAEHDIAEYVPDPPGGLIGFERAVELSLTKVHELQVPTRRAATNEASEPQPTDPGWSGGDLYREERESSVEASGSAMWEIVESIGGDNGWYSPEFAWTVRGSLDRVAGGPGTRRGRPDGRKLAVGDIVDWWRVDAVENGHLLRLRAEMRLPGIAWLEFRVGVDDGTTTLCQTTLFHPQGLAGHLYWWSMKPMHAVVFALMQRNMVQAAEASST